MKDKIIVFADKHWKKSVLLGIMFFGLAFLISLVFPIRVESGIHYGLPFGFYVKKLCPIPEGPASSVFGSTLSSIVNKDVFLAAYFLFDMIFWWIVAVLSIIALKIKNEK